MTKSKSKTVYTSLDQSIETLDFKPMNTGYEALNRVLGGGLVKVVSESNLILQRYFLTLIL